MKAAELLKTIDPSAHKRVSEFKEKQRQSDLVRLFEKCDACGTTLHFNYHKDSPKGLIVEHASCLSCGATCPSRLYKIC